MQIELKNKKTVKFFLSFFLFVFSPLAYSVKVNRIDIKGNHIVEEKLIRSHIQLKKGSVYSEKKIQADVRQLFSLDFFDNIEVSAFPVKKGFNILYDFKERVVISEVEFKGNKHVKTDSLKELSLVKGHEFLNQDKLQRTFLAIKNKYKEKGYYVSEVSHKLEKDKTEKDKFKLVIEIKEDTKLLIKRISFVGNRNIPSQKIKPFMKTKEKSLFSFLSSAGVFNPELIDRDLQFIGYYYRDKGYLNVRVKKPEITISPDKRFLYITFFISEGSRVKVGDVLFKGDDIISSEEVQDRLSLSGQEYFSISRLQRDLQMIINLYKNKGYAFAVVNPLFYPDPAEEDKIHVLFEVKKGDVYKVRRTTLVGNKNARDKVLLRRLHLREGDTYNESKKELSQQLLQQLGYFEEVQFQIAQADTKDKELDLVVQVKERESTGEARISGGYNNQTRLFVAGGVKKQNFLGLDQSIALDVLFNKYQETFTFSYRIPYFLDSRWNFAFDIFNVSQDTLRGGSSINTLFLSDNYTSPYSRLDTGFSVSLGRHVTDFSTVFLKYKLQRQDLDEDSIYFLRDLPVFSSVFDFLFGKKAKLSELYNQKVDLIDEEPLPYPSFTDVYNLSEGKGMNSSLSVIWEYDKRNDRYYASKGFFTRLSSEYSGLGGNFDYTKIMGKV